jgi:hypothetical protein
MFQGDTQTRCPRQHFSSIRSQHPARHEPRRAPSITPRAQRGDLRRDGRPLRGVLRPRPHHRDHLHQRQDRRVRAGEHPHRGRGHVDRRGLQQPGHRRSRCLPNRHRGRVHRRDRALNPPARRRVPQRQPDGARRGVRALLPRRRTADGSHKGRGMPRAGCRPRSGTGSGRSTRRAPRRRAPRAPCPCRWRRCARARARARRGVRRRRPRRRRRRGRLPSAASRARADR